jgi:hypothetical protein
MYFDADIIALDGMSWKSNQANHRPFERLRCWCGPSRKFVCILVLTADLFQCNCQRPRGQDENSVCAYLNHANNSVTHALHFLPHVDFVITMENGRIAERGTYSELKRGDGPFSRLIAEFGAEDEHEAEDEKEETAIENAKPASTPDRSKLTGAGVGQALIQAEERNAGSLKASTVVAYVKAGRGPIMLPLLFLALVVGQAFTVMTSVWLTYWIETKWDYGQGFVSKRFMQLTAVHGYLRWSGHWKCIRTLCNGLRSSMSVAEHADGRH